VQKYLTEVSLLLPFSLFFFLVGQTLRLFCLGHVEKMRRATDDLSPIIVKVNLLVLLY